MRLLVVEDDNRVMSALRTVLGKHGFQVQCAGTAAQALELLPSRPDVLLLDVGLPDQDGFKLCREVRRRSDVPIIMVTALGDHQSRVHGLNLGADDYLVKPYHLAELIARIHAVTRRRPVAAPVRSAAPVPSERGPSEPGPSEPGPSEPGLGPVRIAADTRTVTVHDRPVQLTRKEFDLLALLAQQPGVVYRREQIISQVWESGWRGTGRTLEVHVASLRVKLGAPGLIETVRGVGYRLNTTAVR